MDYGLWPNPPYELTHRARIFNADFCTSADNPRQARAGVKAAGEVLSWPLFERFDGSESRVGQRLAGRFYDGVSRAVGGVWDARGLSPQAPCPLAARKRHPNNVREADSKAGM